MSKILALWSTFRAVSTAFECMMRERGDFVVFHEPFGLSFYNSEERRNTNRYPDAEIKAENNYQATRQKLQEEAKQHQVFIKDMPYYISHLIKPEFVAEFENTFLVRDPAKMLLSLHYRWPDFTLEETGYESLYRYFMMARDISGKIPVLIDANDLLNHPDLTIKAYCEAVGIPFMPKALTWEQKSRPEINQWENGLWHSSLNTSTGLRDRKQKEINYGTLEDSDHLKQAYEYCLPYYQKLYEHRLRIE
jgi:hypothetical protein